MQCTFYVSLHSMAHESVIDHYEAQQKEVLLLMQSKLPECIVNCFVAAGFDIKYACQ